ncbi:hypothetical protein KR067_001235, partial [Drosophila pandora]
AIKKLNSLQSNDAAIRNSVNNPKVDTVKDTIKYLERSGLPLETVEQLSFIHVAGTKGKGSTCALTESLLRHHGYRTGFFSSPHILSTNERIRIDGQPVAKDKFTEHFWKAYNRLWDRREHEYDMPAYFKFLTILGFHIFLAEKVDVAVLEVGIGGECDSTNILRNVKTVGITSLGLEHTELLGGTLEQIAWQKAGIIKPGSHVFTHVGQEQCLRVIRERIEEKKATLFVVPPTEDYFQEDKKYSRYWTTFNHFIRLNGSLAIQLASDWLSRQSKDNLTPKNWSPNEVYMNDVVLEGLVNTHWPGRCQLVDWRGMRLHLDGAHTIESMAVCTDWFVKSIKGSNNPKILIFNRTGESGFEPLLELLNSTCAFDMACFVPNLATNMPNAPSQVMVRFTAEMQMKRAKMIAEEWRKISDRLGQEDRGQVFGTLCDAFTAIRDRYPADSENGKLDVLVTGSIHLLGAAISALDLIDQAKN